VAEYLADHARSTPSARILASTSGNSNVRHSTVCARTQDAEFIAWPLLVAPSSALCYFRSRTYSERFPVKASELLKPGNREEAELLDRLDLKRLPQHLAVIMDGNGRWAERRHLPRIAGHRAGVKAAREVIESCARLKLPYLTLYAFSLENWRRPRAEVDFLMRLLREYLKRELPTIHKNNIRLLVIGRSEQLPEGVRKDIEQGMRMTARNTGMKLVVALNYGGRAELVDAFNSMLDHVRSNGVSAFHADERSISEHLYTAGLPDPDLLIRTSGEMRVSNFLLWQIAYAEIYVTETLWPDFSRARLLEALVDFQKRERRYGGLSSAPERDGSASGPERQRRG
jgi:undecaprenyl diphosphate synthase